MMASLSMIDEKVGKKNTAPLVSEMKAAWKERDYAKTQSLSRDLLDLEPTSVVGLIYLGRGAVGLKDWAEAAQVGRTLAVASPRDAFVIARELNRVEHTAEALEIYADLPSDGDWLDPQVTDLAWKEGLLLLKTGDAAYSTGDNDLAKRAWVTGARLAPSSRILNSRVRDLITAAKQRVREQDEHSDPETRIDAWRELLWLNPSNLSAASKIAALLGKGADKAAAVDAWLKVLSIEPNDEKAAERIMALATRNGLEDRAIDGLSELGRDDADPLVRELAVSRDAKADEARQTAQRTELRAALSVARPIDREGEPARYLEAWKAVLTADRTNMSAARKVVSVARQLGEASDLVDGLIAIFDVTPDDEAIRERLVRAALNAGEEQTALDCLTRHHAVDLTVPKIESLHKRLYRACRDFALVGDFERALSCFETLAGVDSQHPWVETLRPSLARKAAASAKSAEKAGDLATAASMAERVLQIVPDQPLALTVLARHMMRRRLFGDVIDLCEPRIRPGEEYDSVRKLLDQATAKRAA